MNRLMTLAEIANQVMTRQPLRGLNKSQNTAISTDSLANPT